MIDAAMMKDTLERILDRTARSLGAEAFRASTFKRAAELLHKFSTGEFQEFLTTAAYAELA